jgi:hypothetical protein
MEGMRLPAVSITWHANLVMRRRRQEKPGSHLIPPAGRVALVCGIELQCDVNLDVEIPVPDVQKQEKIY